MTERPQRAGAETIPVIDVSSLVDGSDIEPVGALIDAACRRHGFFTISGHGVDPALREALESSTREFFALDWTDKSQIAMERGGRAWRGWFGLGEELTSGVADAKEGIYFGTELSPDDPRVTSGKLLHGPNLWPQRPSGLRPAVNDWMAAMRDLAAAIMRGISVGLGLDADYFKRYLTAEPTVLFRAFRYPPVPRKELTWGVGEHTDYGLLTILAQDGNGGLQVRTANGWTDVPPDPDVLVCNIGDMLDRMTGGRYRSTPHRVLSSSVRDRVSFPYFFDPGWEATVEEIPIPGDAPPDDGEGRWDGTSLRDLSGTYGEYLSAKVSKVFPTLKEEVAGRGNSQTAGQ
ncbi:MAG: 2-oxoglutarate and iron-dependent oxygenase domain-containing protein [Microthrixaceae bacterium]